MGIGPPYANRGPALTRPRSLRTFVRFVALTRTRNVMSMDRREFLTASAIGSLTLGHSVITPGDLLVDTRSPDPQAGAASTAGTRKILIAGGGFNTAYIRYMAALSGKNIEDIR